MKRKEVVQWKKIVFCKISFAIHSVQLDDDRLNRLHLRMVVYDAKKQVLDGRWKYVKLCLAQLLMRKGRI